MTQRKKPRGTRTPVRLERTERTPVETKRVWVRTERIPVETKRVWVQLRPVAVPPVREEDRAARQFVRLSAMMVKRLTQAAKAGERRLWRPSLRLEQVSLIMAHAALCLAAEYATDFVARTRKAGEMMPSMLSKKERQEMAHRFSDRLREALSQGFATEPEASRREEGR